MDPNVKSIGPGPQNQGIFASPDMFVIIYIKPLDQNISYTCIYTKKMIL